MEKDYNKMSLWQFIRSSKKNTFSVLIGLVFGLIFFFGAMFSTDLGWGQPAIMVGSLLWSSLFVLEKLLILKKLRK